MLTAGAFRQHDPELWGVCFCLMWRQEETSVVLEMELSKRKSCESLTSLYCKASLAIIALAGNSSQTWDKKADTTLMLILYKFLYHVSFLCRLVQNTYTENNPCQDLSTENSLITRLAQTAVGKPKPPAWLLPSMQKEKSWAASLPSSQTAQTYQGGLRKHQRGHLSTALCASVEKQPMAPKNGKNKLHNGYCQMPLTCYQQKSTPWHDKKSIFLCMMKHSGAICSQRVANISGCKSVWKLVAHFWMSHLYHRCFHQDSSVVICILRTTALADSLSL